MRGGEGEVIITVTELNKPLGLWVRLQWPWTWQQMVRLPESVTVRRGELHSLTVLTPQTRTSDWDSGSFSLSVRKCKFYFFVLNGLSEVCFCGGIYRGLDLYVEKYDKVPEGSILLAVLYQSNKSGIFTSSESAFSL